MINVAQHGKLWEVGSVEAFKDVWVHCLECHYFCHVAARVLHRNVNENSLQFKICDDGQVIGVLNGWDMASWVDDKTGDIPLSDAQRRTGTLPFMAKDLLVANLPAHLYRHDLESFFYVLIWAALHYDFTNKTRASEVHPAVMAWNSSTMISAHYNKDDLLQRKADIDEIITQIPPRCQGLVPWILAIWNLFDKANNSQRNCRSTDAGASWDKKTCGGWITAEKFMEAVGRTIRSWEPGSN